MRYQLRQHILSFGDDYTITDEFGHPRFIVDGAVFTLRESTSFRDPAGRELCHIHRRLLSLGPTYEITRNGNGGGTTTVSKHLFTLFNCRFTVDQPGRNDFEASGNFTDHEYTFRDTQGNTIATVSKRWFSFSDTYGVDIAEGEDDVLILAATVVIDHCCHPDRKR